MVVRLAGAAEVVEVGLLQLRFEVVLEQEVAVVVADDAGSALGVDEGLPDLLGPRLRHRPVDPRLLLEQHDEAVGIGGLLLVRDAQTELGGSARLSWPLGAQVYTPNDVN